MVKRLDYKWVIAAASILLCVVGLGLCSGNASLFVVATTEALGISRSAYALGDSLRYITTAVMNMFFGALIMRFGARKLIAAGIVTLILSCVAKAMATNAMGLYLGGVLLGIGLTLGGTTIVGYVIKQWFAERQGAVLGVVLSTNALGAAISAPWFSSVIYGADPFGYRTAYWVTAAILLVSGVILVLAFRDAPNGKTVELKKTPKRTGGLGIVYTDKIYKPYFYLICVSLVLAGFLLASSTGIAAAHMKDRGMDPAVVAVVTGMYSLLLAGGKFLIGAVSDKKGLRIAVLICDVAALIMVILLCLVSGSVTGKVLAMVYALMAGIAVPWQTVLLPLMAGGIYSDKDYGKVLGIFTAANSLGFVIGNTVSNFCFDLFGTYYHVLVADCVIAIAVGAAFLFAYQKMNSLLNLKV